MKTLGLLRHATSPSGVTSLRDFDRGLNDQGRRDAAIIGGHIRDQAVAWDLLLASPAERVKRTIEAMGLAIPIRWDERIYLAHGPGLLDVLRGLDEDPGAVLIAGHNPGLPELILDLVAPTRENILFAAISERYPTATFAVLELAIDRWEECLPGCGMLVHLVRPSDLDPELGPEEGR